MRLRNADSVRPHEIACERVMRPCCWATRSSTADLSNNKVRPMPDNMPDATDSADAFSSRAPPALTEDGRWHSGAEFSWGQDRRKQGRGRGAGQAHGGRGRRSGRSAGTVAGMTGLFARPRAEIAPGAVHLPG